MTSPLTTKGPSRPVHLGITARISIIAIGLVALFTLCVCLLVLWPMLTMEASRFTTLQMASLWLSEACALVWFLVFIVRHGVLGHSMRHAATRLLIISMVIAFVGDILLTGGSYYLETRAFKRAVPAVATATYVAHNTWLNEGKPVHNYKVDYQFIAPDGNTHEGRFKVAVNRALFGVRPPMPRDLIAAIETGRTPFDIPITYDPQFPGKIWPTGMSADGNGDGIIVFSLCLHGFQIIFMLILSLSIYEAAKKKSQRWVIGLYKTVPFLAELLSLLFFSIVAVEFI